MSLSITRPVVAPAAIKDLLTMLTYRRPAKSTTEAQFIQDFVVPLGATPDAFGNHWRVIGKGSPILWSCHTDTVHKGDGKQSVEYGDGYVTTPVGSCLGADCGAGVWLMSRMIKAGIPGTYVFHREEEIGGFGSAYVAKETPERLAGLKYAIAFDRKGTGDIITHQLGGRCASDAFAQSLSRVLNMGHTPDDSGTFTDTANYADIIPECSNLAVGYGKAHSPNEYLDCVYLCQLLKAILSADWSQLVCERDPTVPDPEDFAWWTNGNAEPLMPKASYSVDRKRVVDCSREMEDLVYQNPDGVAAFLEACGYDVADLQTFLDEL